jgi:hypothetical protein
MAGGRAIEAASSIKPRAEAASDAARNRATAGEWCGGFTVFQPARPAVGEWRSERMMGSTYRAPAEKEIADGNRHPK